MIDFEPLRQVAFVDDDETLRATSVQTLSLAGLDPLPFPGTIAALERIDRDFPGVVVTDVRMPGMDGLQLFRRLRDIDPELPIILVTGHGDIAMAVAALKDGAWDFVTKPFSGDHTPAILRLRETMRQIANALLDVLIEGETGTGKEMVAILLQRWSARRSHPFVAFHSGALPEAHSESKLFGYLDGVVPGARLSRIGVIENSHRDTLFLDQLEAMSEPLQMRMLRVLEEREITPLGSDLSRAVDIRVIGRCRAMRRRWSNEGSFVAISTIGSMPFRCAFRAPRAAGRRSDPVRPLREGYRRARAEIRAGDKRSGPSSSPPA